MERFEKELKFMPKRDITYCTNNKCSQKNDCFRWQGHWKFPNDYYEFSEFIEEECIKGIAKNYIKKAEE